MLIANGSLTRQALAGKVIVVTGAGQGIGVEAARALLWLGARVVIAEINARAGRAAAAQMAEDFGAGSVRFIHTDVGDERSVNRLARETRRVFGPVDGVINNATLAPVGAVAELPAIRGRRAPASPLRDWDASYRVNLRGPVLLARAFLPDMLARSSGLFACVSSYGIAYMGAYETMKAAQSELAGVLSAEVEGSRVCVFTIGPGAVPTATLLRTIPRLAEWHGKTADEMYALFSTQTLSVEAAGAGFAAAAALAFADPARYHGLEISSGQALSDAGIAFETGGALIPSVALDEPGLDEACRLAQRVRATLLEQSQGWKQRPVFEAQWMARTFNRQVGMPVEPCLDLLARLETAAVQRDRAGLAAANAPLQALAGFYANLAEMARGYVKDPAQREEYVAMVNGWAADAGALARLLARREQP